MMGSNGVLPRGLRKDLVIAAAVTVSGLATLLLSQARSVGVMVVAMMLQGLGFGFGMYLSVMVLLITD